MINKDRLVDKFLEYVKVDSESGNEAEICKLLVEEMKAIGMEVYTDNAGEKAESNGNNVYGYLKGDLDIDPILFSAHMDTVTPGNGVNPVIKNGVISSSGDTILGGDDKSGIAAVLEAIKTIKENDLSHGPIEVAFTIYEEGGLRGSKNLEYDKINSKKAFVLDSGGQIGKTIVQAPAQAKMIFKVIGKPAHAGLAPETGISAIQVASEAIHNMNLLRIDEETTANIGMFNGGQATNIVCPEVEVIAEARSLNNEKLKVQSEHMVKCFKDAAEKFGAKLECEVINMYPAFKVDTNEEIVKIVEKACEKLELDFETAPTGGGCDANIFNCKGITAVNLSTGMSKVHTLDEFIKIEDLEKITKLVLEIMLRK